MDVVSGDKPTTRLAKFQSKCHHKQTNTQLFTGRMPLLSPNQQCQSSEGIVYTIFRNKGQLYFVLHLHQSHTDINNVRQAAVGETFNKSAHYTHHFA